MSDARTGVLELTLGDPYIGSAYSPQVEVTDTATGHEVAITYMSPSGLVTERFDVADGEQGPQGPAGFSPTVTITDTPTGHTVTITDEDGPHSYDVPSYAQEEQERQQAWDALSGEVTDAISDAETATSAASAAASSATSAATSATTAATSATTAATSATTAATSANTAASAATSAATAANSAATAAGTAADTATTAAGDATDAASAANTAAQAAQEAAKGISSAADALMGEPSESTWATRTSTGSGMARVESVQGAAVKWNQNVRNNNTGTTATGITFTNNGDGSWTVDGTASAETFRYADNPQRQYLIVGHKYLAKGCPAGGSASTYLYRDSWWRSFTDYGAGAIFTVAEGRQDCTPSIVVANGATVNNIVFRPQLFDLTTMFGAGNEPTTVAEFERMYPEAYYPYSAPTLKPVRIAGIQSADENGDALDSVEWTAQTLRAAGSVRDELTAGELVTRVGVRAYQSGDESDATVHTDGTTTYYPLATPTTTPISPALPMTYRVQQGGTESIVVPEGEISAAPVLTVAEGESAADLVMDALAAIAAPDGPTATANHAVNTYLTLQGKLYKVTSAIAVGETLKSGTNVSETTVMAELIARTA